MSTNKVSIESIWVELILNWPEPRSHRDIQVFLGFANFNWQFIKGFAWISSALSNMLKSGKKDKFSGKFTLDAKAKMAFEQLQAAFVTTPMLRYFNPMQKICIEFDASGFTVSAVISQLEPDMDQWHSIAYWSQKMTLAKRNYDVRETEMLAIIGACKQWHHYVKRAAHKIQVLINCANFWTFLTTKPLNRREAHWWEQLSRLDMAIEYQPSRLNPANSLSCRSNYEKKNEPAALARTLQSAIESVSWLSQRHPEEPVGRKWSRTQIIIPSFSTSDRAILTHFTMPVDPRQGNTTRNTSGSRKASLQILT